MQLDGHPVLSPPSLWCGLGSRHATPLLIFTRFGWLYSRHKVLDCPVGPYGATISRHRGFSSIGLSTARQVSIAGMTQPISAQAIGPPARLIWRLS